MFRLILLLSLYLGIINYAFATSTSTNALYNGNWIGVTSGAPGTNQMNTFNHTAANAALTVAGGVLADLSYSTNIFNGDILAEGDGSGNSTLDLSNSTNTVTQDVTSQNGCVINFARSNNVINGIVTAYGAAYFNSYGAGNASNNLASLLVDLGGVTTLSNTGSGSVTNTLTNLTVLNGSFADFSNTGSGSTVNTIDTVSLSSGNLYLGGAGSATAITTMNWSGGELDIVYANGGFGTTSIQNLNITAPVTLTLYDSNTASPLLAVPGGGPFTLFTVSHFSGNANQIILVNTSPFVEVISAGSPSGVILQNDGTVQVNLAPVATINSSNTINVLTGALDNTLMMAIQHSQMLAVQSLLPAYSAKTIERLQKTFSDQSKDNFEALVSAFSDSNSPILWNSRAWIMPYALGVSNSAQQSDSGFREKSYGLLFGGSHYLHSMDINLTGVLGAGMTKVRSEKINGKTKNVILGLVATKEFWDENIDIVSSLYAMGFNNDQYRKGNPTPTQSYIAGSHYKSGALSWQNEVGYEIDIREDFFLRPNVGLQLLANYRPAFTEDNAGIFSQRYRRQVGFSEEIYAGIGAHKEWFSSRYEGKSILSYEIGKLSGNQRSTVRVFAETAPQGITVSNVMPGSLIQYLNLYGSILDTERSIRVVPGCSYSFQRNQHSLWGSLKVEHVW